MGKREEEAGAAVVSLMDYSVVQGTSLASGSAQASQGTGDVQKSNAGHSHRATRAMG